VEEAEMLRPFLAALILAACIAGCHSDVPDPVAPSGDGDASSGTGGTLPPGMTAGQGTGPVAIAYLAGTVAPNGTVSGCGSEVSGCAGRVALTFRLKGPSSGTVLFVRGFLHATNKQACLIGQVPGFQLEAGLARDVTLTFDQPQGCQVPLDIANLAVVVEGVVQVASRQEWAVTYAFRP
jgi:hypothetical protein